jgi:hypothetical protein
MELLLFIYFGVYFVFLYIFECLIISFFTCLLVQRICLISTSILPLLSFLIYCTVSVCEIYCETASLVFYCRMMRRVENSNVVLLFCFVLLSYVDAVSFCSSSGGEAWL